MTERIFRNKKTLKHFTSADTNALIIAIAFFQLLFSCGNTEGNTGSDPVNPELDSMQAIWNYYNRVGSYDSLISCTRPFLEEARKEKDSLSVLYSVTGISQAYLFAGNIDSVKAYMDYTEEYKDYSQQLADSKINALIYLIEGSYAMKVSLDYSYALKSYLAGYECIADDNDINNSIVFLSNITHIFYIRSDKNGMEYSQKAWELSENTANTQAHCIAAVAMAQMNYISGQFEKALEYSAFAEKVAIENRQLSQLAVINLIYADIYSKNGMPDKAYAKYNEAVRYSEYTEPGTISCIFLNFGDLKEKTGLIGDAISLYKQGLAISLRHKNVEFRSELLKRLASLYYKTNEKDSALAYYHAYGLHSDNVAKDDMERKLNELLIHTLNIEHDNENALNRMAIMEANRRTVICIFIIIIMMTIILSAYFIKIRKNKMNRLLVQQDRNYRQRIDIEKSFRFPIAEKANDENLKDRELYEKIESLMDKDKIYRRKDISLDIIAEALGTNRTYISKCINNIAKMTFYNYINMYRIREATDIISKGNMNFKELSDFLGYSSLSVFYRAFQRDTGLLPGKYRQAIRNT